MVETAVLHALRRLQLRPDAVWTKCARVVEVAATEFGVGPRWAYATLCELATPWSVPVRLIDFNGNRGSKDLPAADPRFTEARLSPAGVLALAAEEGSLAPLPLGLINGDCYLDGPRPPFEPGRIIRTLLAVVENPAVSDEDVLRAVGGPVFPAGCEVRGDLDALTRGEECTLELSARMTPEPDGRSVTLTDLPPGVGAHRLVDLLDPATEDSVRDSHWPFVTTAPTGIREVRNVSFASTERVLCLLEPEVDPAEQRFAADFVSASRDQPAVVGSPGASEDPVSATSRVGRHHE